MLIELFAVVVILLLVLNIYLQVKKPNSSTGEIDKLTDSIKSGQQALHSRLDNAANQYTKLSEEMGKFSEIGRSLGSVTDLLKNPKLRGGLGEQILADMLAQMLPNSIYRIQFRFKSGLIADAVVKTRSGLIPIDSKFPLENYRKMVVEKNENEVKRHENRLKSDVRKHIKDISKKYISAEDKTLDFGLMYIPNESIFTYLTTNAELQDYANSNRVYMVSPNSLYYFLQIILLGLENEKIEEKAKNILDNMKGISNTSDLLAEDMKVLNGHIQRSNNSISKVIQSQELLSSKISIVNESRLVTEKKQLNNKNI